MIIKIIKQFFEKIFRINKIKHIEAPILELDEKNKENIGKNESNCNFKENMKLENNKEYIILKLQKELEEGKIEAKDISKEETKELISLYLDQIIEQLKEINKIEATLKND